MRSSVPRDSNWEQPAGSAGADDDDATDGAGLETTGGVDTLGVTDTLGSGVGACWGLVVHPVRTSPPIIVAQATRPFSGARLSGADMAAG